MHRLLCSLLIAAGALGCEGASVTLDAGPSPDATVPRGRLVVATEVPIALTFGQEAELVVRYTEERRPVEGRAIRFALEGTAHDSTLSGLTADTDPEGFARIRLLAGSVPAVFRVRASREGTSPVFADVSVGDEGFGGFVVVADYQGMRGPVVERLVAVYPNTECDPPGGYPSFPARMATLEDPEVTEVEWSALSAGLTYAVLGTVEGPTGEVLAQGCRDELLVEAGLVTRVELVYADEALLPEGLYEAELTVGSTEVGALISDRALEAATTFLGGGVGAYLDALEAELRDASETDAADALALARSGGDAETRLATALEAAGKGFSHALDALIARLAERLSDLRIGGPLDVAAGSTEATGLFTPESVTLGRSVPDGLSPLSLPGETVPMVTLSFDWFGDRDELALTASTIDLPLGELSTAAIDAEAVGASGPGAALLSGAGCEVFAEWISAEPSVSGVCDEACANASCTRALDELAVGVQTSLGGLDAIRAEVVLSGVITTADTDGDLLVDTVTGAELGARWTGPADLTGGEATGALLGARIER